MQLRGSTALITGASRRIGRAIAERLADAGCNVALHCRHADEHAHACRDACAARGVRAVTLEASLLDPDAVAALPGLVVAEFGRLDILINNAATFEPMSLADFSLDRWQRDLAVNLTAPMILAHASAAALRSAGGRVINLCDAAAERPFPGYLSYCTSKAALESLTRSLALALAPEVCVVGVAPGVALWPDPMDSATKERLLSRIPLGRSGEPSDIAELIHFLLERGDYITGQILRVDGGRALR
ncbi:MAG: SDR family oxidoreductase [Planctomycetia bacterium]|nr:MAG: SDR family oxidoreductase [Planctomycetia bacterium]